MSAPRSYKESRFQESLDVALTHDSTFSHLRNISTSVRTTLVASKNLDTSWVTEEEFNPFAIQRVETKIVHSVRYKVSVTL